ncbi:4224_t:CDS:1 [Paraglomus occultum]|uniref:4224_t:CDS:1 n=1 Tax=Paraglomus occultum TaxID=144539 RepID=A0A9N8ZY50_9GLOM|nr:4224_t:CDS:1 [Paraglomus occultum]
MLLIFDTDDLMKQFEEEYNKTRPICTMDELLLYDTKPNKNGDPKRTSNASIIYLRECSKRLKGQVPFEGGAKTLVKIAMEEWNRLPPSKQRLYELAADIVERRFKEMYPGYRYTPYRTNGKRKRVRDGRSANNGSNKCNNANAKNNYANIRDNEVDPKPDDLATKSPEIFFSDDTISHFNNCFPLQSPETRPEPVPTNIIAQCMQSFVLVSPPTPEYALSDEFLEYITPPEQQPTVEHVDDDNDDDMDTENVTLLYVREELNNQLDLFEEEFKNGSSSNTDHYSDSNLYQFY